MLAVCDVWRDRRERACQRVNAHYAQTYGQSEAKVCKAYTDFRLYVRDVKDASATQAFADLLPKVAAPVQTALVEGLAQRRDASAATALVALLPTASPEVKRQPCRSCSSSPETVRPPARPGVRQALGALAQAPQVPDLVRLVLEAKAEAERAGASAA